MAGGADEREPARDPFAMYFAYALAVLGLTASTVRHHRNYLRSFARWWASARPGQAIAGARSADIAAFLVAEAARGMSPATRKSQMGALRHYFDWLVLNEQIGANPAARVPSPRVPPRQLETYTAAQVEAILAHTATLTDVRGRQRHAIVATLRYTGVRNGELRLLRTSDLDLAAGRARVVGKGSRERVLLLPPPLVPILAAFVEEVRPQLPDSPLLFANAHCLVTTPMHGMGQEAVAREVELAGIGAGVPGRHYPHRWRHTYATELVRSGVGIHVVQRLMGHIHIASTVGYTHLSVDDLRDQLAERWRPASGLT